MTCNKLLKAAVLLSTALFSVIGCTGSNDLNVDFELPGKIIQIKTEDWEIIQMPDFVILNNVWGKENLSGYDQEILVCNSPEGVKFGWHWDWPQTNRVLAYPSIIYGASPWDTTVYPDYPRLIGDADITLSYSCTVEVTPVCNLAMEFWICSTEVPSPDTITHEIMIWTLTRNMTPAGTWQGTIVHNGVNFDVYIKDDHDPGSGSEASGWKYVAFQTQEDRLADDLDISVFIDYLVDNGQITRDLYITGFQMGSEIIGGEGLVLFDDFTVTTE